MSLLLHGATLLHLDPPGVAVSDLRIAEDRIVDVGEELTLHEGDRLIDLSGQLVMPGLVCAHTHLYSALACGMPLPVLELASFAEMLAAVWWRLDRALDLDSVRASALVGGLGALAAGVTTVIDHHASPNAIGGSLEVIDQTLDEIGLRRILCYEVSDRGGPERAAAGIAAHEGLFAAGRARGMRGVLVGGHASFTLTDATLRAMVALARDNGVGLHLHGAEAADDAALSGEPVVERLARLGALLPGSILAHGVHLSPQDLGRLEDAGVWLTHQPRSNQNNAVGYAPVAAFGPHTALGTDGIGADLFAELQSGYFRSREGRVGWSPDRWLELLAAGARLAGETLGLPLGILEAGAAADLVVLDPQPGPPISRENLAASLIFRLSAADVRHTMVAGSWRSWERRPTGTDLRFAAALAQREAPRLWDRMSSLP